MRLKLCLLAVLAAVVVFSIRVSSQEKAASTVEVSQDELSVVLEGCRNAAASIHSGKGQVKILSYQGNEDGIWWEGSTTYTVAFSGSRFKETSETTVLKNVPQVPPPSGAGIEAPGAVNTEQVAYDGEKATTVSSTEHRALIYAPRVVGSWVGVGTFWRVKPNSFTLVDITNFGAPPPDTVREAPRLVDRETIGGDDCIIVELYDHSPMPDVGAPGHERWTWFWVDPQKGFAVPRIRIWGRGSAYPERTLLSETTSGLRQYAGGLWGPDKKTHCEYRLGPTSGKNYKESEEVVTYSPDFQFNVPVEESDLQLTIPSGTVVTNELLQETYTVP